MPTFFDDVGDFHKKFDLPVGGPCHLPTYEIVDYRLAFLDEEMQELEAALMKRDMPAALDALVDLVYVALGTAHYMGAPFNEAWNAVQEANMKKEKATPGSPAHKRGAIEPMRKPNGWRPPDLKKIIDNHNGDHK